MTSAAGGLILAILCQSQAQIDIRIFIPVSLLAGALGCGSVHLYFTYNQVACITQK